MNDPRAITQAELRQVLASCDTDSARSLGRSLDRASPDPISVHPAPDLIDMRRIYARRLRRFQRGEGPQTRDLEAFVDILDVGGTAGMFQWSDDDWHYVGILRERRLLALTSVRRTDRAANGGSA